MTAPQPACYDTDAARWAALRARDAAADASFLYAVVSTGVYCRPSCAARPARPENVRFHRDRASAEAAGFRPCLRCRPDLPPRAERAAAIAAAACRAIEAAETPPPLEALAAAAGLSPFHFHRLFRGVVGLTPRQYAASCRASRVRAALGRGEPVTGALYGAGYGSSGRFYAEADAVLGMTPGAYRAGGQGERIRHAFGPSALGRVLVAATGRGVCAILLGDADAELLAELHARFPRAVHAPAEPEFAGCVAQVVAHVDDPHRQLLLPLDIGGTVFQRRVWEELRTIPAGDTLSYAALAARLGAPRAVRAVAGACAANPLAVAVPCHRVVAADGGLRGYRWGVERKRALLAREAACASRPDDR